MGVQKKKNVIIGTAGHVDHGKTCLIRALTGIDTDRLEEEKKRGITIELGFAWLDLPDGERAGIIDVPGHERFIKNMFAGAGGIDLALLVIAADEGVMPQTTEHLRILTLLGIPRGIIVLTKCDMVEEEWLDLVEEEVCESVKGSMVEGSKVIRVSSHTGEGIKDLKDEIHKEMSFCKGKPVEEALRIPVDRVFTMSGFGTVITGTMIQGKIVDGQEIMIYPGQTLAKVRSLQVHSQKTGEAVAGQRVAVNLSGIKKEELRRGDVIALPNSMPATYQLDVHLKAIMDEERVIKNNSRVHFYSGAMENLCKIVLMGRETLENGEECYAQLRFETPIALKAGDPFVIRFYSPMETIGGGRILNPLPKKHKRWDENVIKNMEILYKGDKKQRLIEGIRMGSPEFKGLREIQNQLNLEEKPIKNPEAFEELIYINENLWLHQEYIEGFENRLAAILKDYHVKHPLRRGMTREEMRSKLLLTKETLVINGILEALNRREKTIYDQGFLRLKEFTSEYSEEQEKLRRSLEDLYENTGFNPPKIDELEEAVLKNKSLKSVMEAMTLEGAIISVDPKLYFGRKSYRKAMVLFLEIEKEVGEVALGQFRDTLETSRKYAVGILEYWDTKGFTKKTGDARKSTPKMKAFLEMFIEGV